MLGVRSFHESFYGTPKPAETGRRGKKRQSKAKEESENEMAVVGVHYRSFDDDSMAAFVNSPAAQVPWNGDKNLLIDRYDVRHLLQDLSGIRRRRRPPSPSVDVSKEELDYERYRDLEGLENPSPLPEDDACKYENDSGGQYQRVGFNYTSGGDQSVQGESGDRSTEEAAFDPPFFVPEHLLLKLPSSLKVHQIMAGTAKFVIEHGGQAEIVLRVKQAFNPTFGFLMPDHYHHEYFRYLVDNPQLVGIGLNVEPVAAVEVPSEEAEGGLSLLGTAYGDSDEEDETDVAAEAKQNHLEVEDCEAVGKGDNESEERSGGSEHGSHGKKSPTSDLEIAGGSENGTCDSGDSREPARAVEVPGNESQNCVANEGGEVIETGEGVTVEGLTEPLPPGTEVSDPMEVEYEESCVPPEYFEQDVPPYKEPPIQLRRIIDKMVEFISRNGKEFEAIVRERDKKDGRFQFLLPWNEFYPYFSRSLEGARQANESSDPSANNARTDECKVSTFEDTLEDQPVNDHFLNGVIYWDESSLPDTSTEDDKLGMDEIEDAKPGIFHNGVGGMGFEAVMAAVRAATRGLSRAVEDNELPTSQPKSPDRVELPPIGSDDAVIAAIRAVTGAARRSKAEELPAGGRGELVHSGGLNAVSGATDQTPVDVIDGVQEKEKNLSGSVGPASNSEAILGSHGDAVVVGKVVAKAAALAAREEGDSADALLSPSGKRKAERLKKAKLFAAMLREGNGATVQSGHGSGSLGVSATPSVDKSSQAGINMDAKPNEIVSDKVNDVQEATRSAEENFVELTMQFREQTSDLLVVQVLAEDDTQHTSEGGKEQKPRATSKEAVDNHRKHHRKRKSHYDGEDRRTEGKDDADTERRRDRRHDHYHEENRKHRRRDDGKIREKNGYITRETRDEDRYWYDLDERRESRESRKDRRYWHDTDSKRSSRHRYDYEEMWHEDRYGHDLDGNDRNSRQRRRHASEEARLESRHQNSDDKRKINEHKYEAEANRKERRHRQASEERREYRHGSDENRKDRREGHVKGRKHKEDHGRDVSGGEDDADENSHRKSRRHQQETEREKPSIHCGDAPDGRKYGDPESGVHHRVVELLQVHIPTVSTVRVSPPRTPVDVPDDLRAKVRAMLARI